MRRREGGREKEERKTKRESEREKREGERRSIHYDDKLGGNS